jgi:sugar/nucleoside kinase (ribokinase family)
LDLVRWAARGTLVADTYGPALAWAASQPLALLKVNAAEFQTIGTAARGQTMIRASRCVVTDGPRAVTAWDADGDRFEVIPPVVREVSPTGSGDVMFACLIEALFRRRKLLREAVAYALPFAAANAAHPGVAEFPNP